MTAMRPDERVAHMQTTRALFGAVEAVRETPRGYAFQLPADSAPLLRAAEFMTLERLCCPFFGFSLELGPGAVSFTLHLTGPAGVKPFIREEIGAALPASLGFDHTSQAASPSGQ